MLEENARPVLSLLRRVRPSLVNYYCSFLTCPPLSLFVFVVLNEKHISKNMDSSEDKNDNNGGGSLYFLEEIALLSRRLDGIANRPRFDNDIVHPQQGVAPVIFWWNSLSEE